MQIVDAGPCINFLATNHERLLLAVTGRGLYVPARWTVLEANGWMVTLSDEITVELAAAAQDVQLMSLDQRRRNRKDLGETMVVIHAVCLAYAGHDVSVIIDDGAGRQLALQQMGRMNLLRSAGHVVGRMTLHGTVDIIRAAVGRGLVADRAALRKFYARLRTVDDGLPHLDDSGLLDADLWA